MAFLGDILGALTGPIGAIAGPLIGGLIGQHQAAPAQAAQGQVMGTQTDILNALLETYKSQYGPMEQEMVGRERGMISQLPYEQVIGQTLDTLTQPYRTPDPIVLRALMGVQQQTEREQALAGRSMGRRGITGPAAEAIQADIGEAGLKGKYGVLGGLAEQESSMTLQNQLRAFDAVNQLFKGGLGVAGAGRAMLPGMENSLARMSAQYGQAGQAAAAPWMQAGAAVPGAIGQYQNYNMMQPLLQAMTRMYTGGGGAAGGGGGLPMPGTVPADWASYAPPSFQSGPR